MKYFFKTVLKYTKKTGIWIWDFVFFFFGMPYEEQASKLKLDKLDPTLRGRENEKTTHTIYRANKVGKES